MSSKYSSWVISGLVLAYMTNAYSTAYAAQACEGVDTALSAARKHEYALLVAKAMTVKVDPSAVKLRNFMESGPWSAVYASTPVSDDGVFFFQNVNGQKQFKEVWGGSADPSEKPELTKWVRDLGAPERLATCFADVVTRD